MVKQESKSGRGRVKLKTARGRSMSSQQWLRRQLNDPYVKRAKSEGRRSRAAYKLIEIINKYDLTAPGMNVIDFGAAPGGWSEVAAERVRALNGNSEQSGKVIALDVLPIEQIEGVISFEADIYDDALPLKLSELLAGEKAGLLLSDMAPPATGHKQIDHLRCVALVEAAASYIPEFCAEGGSFLAKTWQGGSVSDVLSLLKRDFRKVRHVKPQASRGGSSELYVLATGFHQKQ